MNLADLRQLPNDFAASITDAKEALAEALLNLTWSRCSGEGDEGRVVYGRKPSLQFVSGFLLPRFEESGTVDETSDIHLSTHGLDCQIAAASAGAATIDVSFAIYVRTLPDWQEINRPELDLFPRHPIRRELEQEIRAAVKEQLPAAKAAEEAKPQETRRSYREIQQQLYEALLATKGVRLSSAKAVVVDSAPDPGDDAGAETATNAAEQTAGDEPAPGLLTENGRYIFDSDEAAQTVDAPQRWRRLPITLRPLSIDLANAADAAARAEEWSVAMQQAVTAAVAAWLQTPKGQQRAYRTAAIRPSDVRSEADWNQALTRLRQQAPTASEIAPDLKGLRLGVQIDTDLKDASRRNLRIILENNSNQVGKRRRDRYEHAIHQVRMAVILPAPMHRALRLDRVEPSYRFREFLTYPAIGINCGVSDALQGDSLELRTTWMPRYQQPRTVPQQVNAVPSGFKALGAQGFDPVTLRPLIDAYRAWIGGEETRIDPARGVTDTDAATRERDAFARDLGNYRREADRISLGIDLLEQSFAAYGRSPGSREGTPYRAWLLLNRTFDEAGAERGVEGWRLFQLAFVLAHIPTLASRMAEFAAAPWFDAAFDEETATLLYFPTGGGKSEAFFGLLIFNVFLDRLRGKHLGVTALIRYPLRLLTLQQAQRLLSILVRAELLRRTEAIAGAPFQIGFWVGSGNTPNSSNDPRLGPVPSRSDAARRNDSNATKEYEEVNAAFNKIPVCPLCRRPTGLRRTATSTDDEVGIFCFNDACRWNEETGDAALPFLIIDRDIYRHAPSVLLGVIDKLALIGQHPSTINRVMGMFGLARWQETESGRLVMPTRKLLKTGPASNGCHPVAPAYASGRELFVDPFPSLIIQDEAHLLEESLGTFAGLFETMLEQLFTRAATLLGDRVARRTDGAAAPRLPKVIAATATVSVPQQQFGALYQRRHMHFPYPGTSLYQSFYAAPAIPQNPARRGIAQGVPKGPEIEAPRMRSYVALLTNGHNHTVTTVTILAAYHLAITELWEDLLAPQRRDAARDRILAALTPGALLTPFHEQAIRTAADAAPEILPTLLDLMRISLTYVTNKKGGDQVIDAFREEVAKTHRMHGRPLAQLDTRLISGGVDVAQIQEIMRAAEDSGRAGDPFPDLQTSLRNIVATSAISHGVDVDKFNAMFFAGMPSDIAEFIQASSRVGRSHVGFSLLIPTPQARRDRYIVETHDVFHRFLERMVAPPAITRWAATAHDRVLTSMFQAWLCGWAEQRLFVERPDDDKATAPIFETVHDVHGLLTGRRWPGAAEDFMEFAVLSVGVPGRGADRIGGAPHFTYYDERIRNRAKELTDELRAHSTTTSLHDYWPNAAVGSNPMMSLRDIDEAGRFVAARPMGPRRSRDKSDKELVGEALRIVRRQSGRVSELDSDEGEG